MKTQNNQYHFSGRDPEIFKILKDHLYVQFKLNLAKREIGHLWMIRNIEPVDQKGRWIAELCTRDMNAEEFQRIRDQETNGNRKYSEIEKETLIITLDKNCDFIFDFMSDQN
jgi:hypothetical protein